jgi:hypothetical protein
LNERGTHLAFAELQGRVRDRIIEYGLLETIDRGRLFDTVEEAVAAYQRETGSESGKGADQGHGADSGQPPSRPTSDHPT